MSTIQVLVRGLLILACLAVPVMPVYYLAPWDSVAAFLVFFLGELIALIFAFMIAMMGKPEPAEASAKSA